MCGKAYANMNISRNTVSPIPANATTEVGAPCIINAPIMAAKTITMMGDTISMRLRTSDLNEIMNSPPVA